MLIGSCQMGWWANLGLLGLQSMKDYYVYIMASSRNGTLYIGVTSDLVKRIWEHKHHIHPTSFTSQHAIGSLPGVVGKLGQVFFLGPHGVEVNVGGIIDPGVAVQHDGAVSRGENA